MRFLLVAINAKYIHSNPAIYSMREYVGEPWKEQVLLAEYTINQRMEQILADIYKQKPDIIGISCYIWNWELIKQLLEELHKIMPQLPIWLGGPEVSYEYRSVLEQYPMVTGIMVGEGEKTFQELVKAYDSLFQVTENKEALYRQSAELQIQGTVTKKGNWGAREVLSMEEIPFYETKLSMEEEALNKNRIIYYESSRGCPFRCSYCLSSIEKRVRLRDVALVKKELQYFLDKKVFQVKFIDRTFNCNHQHAKQIWKYIKEHDNGITNFHFEIAADLLDEEELEIMSDMRPGLIQLEIGVQTTNEKTLEAIHRYAKWDSIKRTVRVLKNYGNIHQHLDLIAGLPYEDFESFKKSFGNVYDLRPDQLQLGFLKVLKGSEIHEKAQEYGIIYQSRAPYEVLFTNWLSYDEVQILKQVEEMVELFYNSNQFMHTLECMVRFFENPFDMFLGMAEYFQEMGYFINSPARSYRYQILLDFGTKMEKNLQELWREVLTFDLYQRENVKSRPSFCKNLTEYRNRIGAFYKKDRDSNGFLQDYMNRGYDAKQIMRMTHMEVFHYPVWDMEYLKSINPLEMQPLPEERLILFDYEKRNPLTYGATIYEVTEEK